MTKTLLSSLVFTFFALFALDALDAEAQIITHQNDPAYKPTPQMQITLKFIKARMNEDFEEEVKFIHEKTMSFQKNVIIQGLKKSPTIEMENKILSDLGFKSLDELVNATPSEVYIKSNKYQSSRKGIKDKTRIKEALKNMSIKVIMEGKDGEDIYHIILRRSYDTDIVRVSDIKFVSLRKDEENKWKISLLELNPRVIASLNKPKENKNEAKADGKSSEPKKKAKSPKP